MKRFALLMALAVMFSTVAVAEKPIELGLKAGFGPTLGTKPENGGDYKAICTFDFGLYGHFGIVKLGPGVLAIQPEINFDLCNGVKYGDKKLRYNALDIPILACYDLSVSTISIRPFAGFQFGFPIGEFKYDGAKNGDAKGFLFGAVFGCGVAIPVGPFMVGGDIRYNIDFSKVKDADDNKVMRRGVLMFDASIAYRFR